MKKTVFRVISTVLLFFAVIAVCAAVTVEGSGFLDLSNFAKVVFSGIAIVCVVLSSVTWITEDPRAGKGKLIFLILAIALIILAVFLSEALRPSAMLQYSCP